MTATEFTKVYELAKELGLDSISLLDKLKSIGISVKNHMSELSTDQLSQARGALVPTSKAKSTKSKALSGSAPKVRKRVAAEPVQPQAPAEPEDPQKKSQASTVIRRRVRGDGGTVTTTFSNLSPDSLEPIVEPSVSIPIEKNLEGTADHAEALASTAEALRSGQAEITAEVEQRPVKQAAPSVSVPAVKVAPPPPRRSILKIVQTPPIPPKPVFTTKPAEKKTGAAKPAAKTGAGATPEYKITKVTKEALDQMAEEEAAKKRGFGGRDQPLRPEDVRFADYRKKEVVFLPKRKKIPVGKELKKTIITKPAAHKRVVEMGDQITVQDLAGQLNVRATDLIRKLLSMGQIVTINQAIDFDTVTLVASEYQYEVKNVAFKETQILDTSTDAPQDLSPRPPIVTVMGHVDHGKTSLLDAIREANVAAGEAGGITQHIGAYTVEKDGHLITFIDTPGHEAFTLMRARGANVTDIVILVVAADDGVMPQTREAVSHARAAKVPIIVAVNKIDKPGATPEKIKQQLSELSLLAEDWGGDTMFISVSATQKTNIDKLLEAVLLNAEVLELKANHKARASGTVLEARLEKGKGPVVSVLVKRGSLRVGDPVLAGLIVGKVRALSNSRGETIDSVGPGMAAEILGFESVPGAGDRFDSPATEVNARSIAEHRDIQNKAKALNVGRVSLEDLFSKMQAGSLKELKIVLKTDVYGSTEAIQESLKKLSTEKVRVEVIHCAPGGITESDVNLANASKAIIIGFNVRPETKARALAEAEGVDVKCYSIIYELIDEVKKAMGGLLEKKKIEKFLGRAEVRQIFSVPKIGVIAGTSVVDGKIARSAQIRLLRDSRVVFVGKLGSLKRFKDDVREVATGYECGIGIENYNDLKPGDIIEAFEIELVSQEL